MFRRLIQIFARTKSRRQASETAWAAFIDADRHGLTRFQHEARAELESVLGSLPLELKGGKERYLTGPLPGAGATVFLYEDGAEIQGGPAQLLAERWDYDTPAALIAELVTCALKATQSNKSFKPNPLRGSA